MGEKLCNVHFGGVEVLPDVSVKAPHGICAYFKKGC